MGLRLRPVDTSFYDLFSASALHLVTGAELLAEILADGTDKDEVAARMRAIEQTASDTTRVIIRKVHGTFVTPYDREDLYQLASTMRQVMNRIDEAVDMILLFHVKVMPEEVPQQVEVLQRCADLTAESLPNLRSVRSLRDFVIEIDRLATTADRNHRRFLGRLYSGEFKALEAHKVKDIMHAIEGATDGFQRIASTVEQIVVKES